MASQTGSSTTYYVVQSFTRDRVGLRMDAPIQAFSEGTARRTAERLSSRKAAVMAFARTGNPATGEFDEPRLLARYGQLGEDGEDDLPF